MVCGTARYQYTSLPLTNQQLAWHRCLLAIICALVVRIPPEIRIHADAILLSFSAATLPTFRLSMASAALRKTLSPVSMAPSVGNAVQTVVSALRRVVIDFLFFYFFV